jgi:hypothetical protein
MIFSDLLQMSLAEYILYNMQLETVQPVGWGLFPIS